MFMFAFEDMLEPHVEDEKVLNLVMNSVPHKKVFYNLLLGQNLINLECINAIAVYLSKLTVDEVKKITYDDVVNAVGEYIDTSGYLV